ncbi:MAG: M14 family zinc carboxypeptidase [bacterium]
MDMYCTKMTKKLVLLLWCFFLFGSAEQTFSRVNIYYQNYDELVQLVQTPEISVLKHKSGGYLEAVVEHGYLETLDKSGFEYEVLIKDIATYYKELRSDGRGGVFGNYYLYTEVKQAILDLQSQYPGLVKVDSLPTRSIENRALYVVKVSNSPAANNNKPEVLFCGAIHAYEPIGVSVCMTDMTHLCEDYASDPEIQWLVDNRQIYFIPVMNPDGYVFNETYPSMMWRKNRRLNSGGSYGVDLNRNYPYKWGYDNIGSSPNQTAWNYRGTEPASEPETQAVMDFVNAHQFRAWHNHHSPGDVLLIPFSYVDSYPWDDTLEYYCICREESLLYGFLDWGNSTQTYGYPCNGELGDWAWCDSATYKIYGLVPELGPDYWGGLNDTSEIVGICQNMLRAELYLMEVSGFFPVIFEIIVHDTMPGANNDGVLNPGETAGLQIALQNKAVVDTAFGLCGYLNTVYPHVNVTDSTGNYGDVIRLAQVVNSDPFVVYCSTAANPSDWVHFDLRLDWNTGEYEKTLVCSLQIGPETRIIEERCRPKKHYTVFPTVVSGAIHLPEGTSCKLFDITGRVVLSNKMKPGVYFVEVDNKIVQKVVKIR